MLGSFEMILVQFLMEHPGAYLNELQTELYQRVGIQYATTLCQTFSRYGLTRKGYTMLL